MESVGLPRLPYPGSWAVPWGVGLAEEAAWVDLASQVVAVLEASEVEPSHHHLVVQEEEEEEEG